MARGSAGHERTRRDSNHLAALAAQELDNVFLDVRIERGRVREVGLEQHRVRPDA